MLSYVAPDGVEVKPRLAADGVRRHRGDGPTLRRSRPRNLISSNSAA
jgi:hypothetical protein